MMKDCKILLSSFGGLQYGADLQWNTPLLVGAAYLKEQMTGDGTAYWVHNAGPLIYREPTGWLPCQETATKSQTQQFDGQYAVGNLKLDSEFRRLLCFEAVRTGEPLLPLYDYLEAGYESRRHRHKSARPSPLRQGCDGAHRSDEVLARESRGPFHGRLGWEQVPAAFHTPGNPQGIKPKTHLLLIRTGWHFRETSS